MELNDQDKLLQSALGGQDYLRYASVPATATQVVTATTGEPGQRLIDTPKITVAGTYTAIVSLAGMVTQLEIWLTATIVSGTVTTSVATLFKDKTTAKTSGSGSGVMANATRQNLNITNPSGEQYAVVTIVVTGATPDVTFTQAEYNGI